MQGDGEIASHTTDVASECTVKLHVIKKLTIDGPILLPPREDLPYLAQPISKGESSIAQRLAKDYGIAIEESGPIQFIGTGADLNKATDNGLGRAARFLNVSVDEVRNRATITGSIEIARLPGVVTISLLAPRRTLENKDIAKLVSSQYGLSW
jgi:formamidase